MARGPYPLKLLHVVQLKFMSWNTGSDGRPVSYSVPILLMVLFRNVCSKEDALGDVKTYSTIVELVDVEILNEAPSSFRRILLFVLVQVIVC